MTNFKLTILLVTLTLLLAVTAQAQEAASWLRTRTSANALNPNISVIGDFAAQTGPGVSDGGIALREAEIGLQAAVDPYSRADFFVGIPDGEAPELEEGYVTLLALPLGLQARGGKFRANFSKINLIHPHEQAQADQPLAAARFLGEEGINDAGAELSRIFDLGIYTELSYGFMQGLGGEEGEPVTTTVTDDAGNVVEVETVQPGATIPRKLKNFAHTAKLRAYADLTDAANVDLSVSGALHQPEGFDKKRLAAAELTFRWKPLAEGLYRSAIWRTEGFYADQTLMDSLDPLTGAVTDPARHTFRRGAYSYVEVQPARRWRFGVRGDWSQDPADRRTKDATTGYAPYVTYMVSEFSRVRLQYTQSKAPGQDAEHTGLLQWTVILGPHGAHAF